MGTVARLYCLPMYLPLTLMLSSTAIPVPIGRSITNAIVFTAIPGVTAGDSCPGFAGSMLTRCQPDTAALNRSARTARLMHDLVSGDDNELRRMVAALAVAAQVEAQR